jgi:FdhD protein
MTMATVSDAPLRDGAAPGLGYAPPVSERRLVRLSDAGPEPDVAPVAEEVPVAFVYSGRTHVVMMCSPTDLEDLAVGFTMTEEIVPDATDIGLIQVEQHSRGVELRVEIPPDAVDRLALRTRALAGRTGCGLCGVEAIDDAVRTPRSVSSSMKLGADALWRAGASLEDHQPLNRDTRAVHAAAWATSEGTLRVIREDVGRHNALDKVLGALARAGIDAGSGFLVVTSRASFELVQKAAVAGVPLLAAVSRPTGLAIRLADTAGITLVGLLRGRTANVYSHAERLRTGV